MKRTLVAAVALVTFMDYYSFSFEPPGPKERLRAIGPTKGLAENMRRALDPGGDFEPVPDPKPGDWLAEHRELGQSFEKFLESKPNRPEEARSTLYIQPLGEFPKKRSPSLKRLKEFAGIFFGTETDLLKPSDLKKTGITTRDNPHAGARQLLTGDVLAFLRGRLPEKAFAVVAVTMEDLYPGPDWNFVFGQASLQHRVGVFSFVRYVPAFYGLKRGKDSEKVLLRRSLKVLVHETAHMFGLKHCVFFRCVINGSNHLAESDSRPIHLCPVCLRKLQHSAGFDVAERYRKLGKFYERAGFQDEAGWVGGRLRKIEGGKKPD
ncbi:MAG: archaemetzincin [Elusimicrobiota bacterium]